MKGLQRNLFPGGNTPLGFYSYYNYILSQKQAEIIFCIKGGPGTGKSTLMRSIGDYYLNKGEDVDFLWCSSDPDSLDGVLIKEKNVALLDGTAPHTVDPMTPGAIDEIINLGELWDGNKLKNNKKDILCSMDIIKNLFEMGYYYLTCASAHYDFMAAVLDSIIERKMVCEITSKILKDVGASDVTASKHGDRKKLFVSAITPRGTKNGLESLVDNVDKIIILRAPVGYRSENITGQVADTLVKSGLEIEEYYCPMCPEKKLEHIVIPSKKTAVLTFNKYHNMKNPDYYRTYSIDIDWKKNELKSEIYNEQMKAAEKDIDHAVRMLKSAKAQHDVLEKYYIDAIDFSGIEKIRERIINKIERTL